MDTAEPIFADVAPETWYGEVVERQRGWVSLIAAASTSDDRALDP